MTKPLKKTKDEVHEENKLLKEKLKELTDKLKKTIIGEELDKIGMSMILDDGIYKLVKIAFNSETNEARVLDISEIQGNSKDRAMALYRAKEFLVNEVFQKAR